MVTLQHGQGDVATWSMLWVPGVLIKGPEPTPRASAVSPSCLVSPAFWGWSCYSRLGIHTRTSPQREVGKEGGGPQARGLHLYFCACPPMPGADLPATQQSCAVCT